MKLTYALVLAILTTVILSCSPEGPKSNNDNAATTTAPAATVGGAEQHYICPNCEGQGGPSAGTCMQCGAAFVHNQAYHNQGNATANTPPNISSPNGAISPVIQQPSADQMAPAVQTATGDAQFHYICSAGCGGGGAASGTCPQCGAALAHNQAYHNQSPSSADGPTIQQQTIQPTMDSPAQNANGEFHYVCNACGTGAAAKGTCPSCGTEMAHNAAYHQ